MNLRFRMTSYVWCPQQAGRRKLCFHANQLLPFNRHAKSSKMRYISWNSDEGLTSYGNPDIRARMSENHIYKCFGDFFHRLWNNWSFLTMLEQFWWLKIQISVQNGHAINEILQKVWNHGKNDICKHIIWIFSILKSKCQGSHIVKFRKEIKTSNSS